MIKRLLKIVAVFLFSSCDGQVYSEHSLLLKQIINEKKCLTLFNGDIECINFENKKIYVLPHLDTLASETFLRTTKNNPEFIKLQENFNAIDLINEAYGEPLEIETKKLNANFVFEKNEADIIISFTRIFNIDGNKYCIAQIRNGIETWIFKVIIKNGEYNTELNLVLP